MIWRFICLGLGTPAASLLVLSLALSACGPAPSNRTGASHDHGHSHGHAHTAPHGGTTVALGDELYHLELVQDAAVGTLTGYVLDGHMEHFIRLPIPSFTVEAQRSNRVETLTFRAVANTATGETVGDTSQFVAQSDWLRDSAPFAGVLPELIIRGTRFTNISFRFPQGNEQEPSTQ